MECLTRSKGAAEAVEDAGCGTLAQPRCKKHGAVLGEEEKNIKRRQEGNETAPKLPSAFGGRRQRDKEGRRKEGRRKEGGGKEEGGKEGGTQRQSF